MLAAVILLAQGTWTYTGASGGNWTTTGNWSVSGEVAGTEYPGQDGTDVAILPTGVGTVVLNVNPAAAATLTTRIQGTGVTLRVSTTGSHGTLQFEPSAGGTLTLDASANRTLTVTTLRVLDTGGAQGTVDCNAGGGGGNLTLSFAAGATLDQQSNTILNLKSLGTWTIPTVTVGGNALLNLERATTITTLTVNTVGTAGQKTTITNNSTAGSRTLTIGAGGITINNSGGADNGTFEYDGEGTGARTLTLSMATRPLTIGPDVDADFLVTGNVSHGTLTISDKSSLTFGDHDQGVVRSWTTAGTLTVTDDDAAGAQALIQGNAGAAGETFVFSTATTLSAAGTGDGIDVRTATITLAIGTTNTFTVAAGTVCLMNDATVTTFTWTSGGLSVDGTLRVRPDMTTPTTTTVTELLVNAGTFECLGLFTMANDSDVQVTITGGSVTFGNGDPGDGLSLAGANLPNNALTIADGLTVRVRGSYSHTGNGADTSWAATSTLLLEDQTTTITVADDFGNIRVVSGTLNLNVDLNTDGTAEIDGTLSIEGGAVAIGASDIRVDGNDAVSGNSGVNLTAGSLTMDAAADTLNVVDQPFRVAGGTLTLTAGTLNLGGNLTVDTGGAFSASGTHTTTLNGAAQTIGGTAATGPTFQVLNIAGTLTKTQSAGTAAVNGTFTVSSTLDVLATFTVGESATFAGAGTLSVGAGGLLNVGPATFSAPTTVTLNGTSTVDYNRAGAQTIRLLTYGNLRTSGSGTKSLPAGTTTATGVCTVDAPLDVNAQTLAIVALAGSSTVSNGTITGAVTVTGSPTLSSPVTATEAWTVSGTLSTAGTGAIAFDSSLSAGGTLSLGGTGTVTVTGDLAGGGTITFTAAQTLDLLADMTFTGSFTPGAGTVRYVLAGAQLVGAVTYNDLVIGGSGTKTLAAGTATAGGLCTVDSTFDLNSQTLAIVSLTGTGIVTNGTITGAVTVSGSPTLSSPVTASGAWTISGTLSTSGAGAISFGSTLAADGTLSLGGTGVVTVTGDLGGAGTLTFVTAQTLDLGAGLPFSGAFTAGTGTVRYVAAGAQTVANVVYNDLVIAGGGTKTLSAGTTTVVGVCTVNSTLGLGGQTLAITALAGTGTVTNGTITGTVTVTGSPTLSSPVTAPGAWTVSGTLSTAGSGAIDFGSNLIANGTFSLGGTGTVTVTGNLDGTGTITFTAAQTLDLEGICAFNATFNAGTGTMRYTAALGQGVRPFTYNHLGAAGAGTKTLTGATIVNGTLTVSSTLDVNGQTLTPATLAGTGTITGSGTIAGAVIVAGGASLSLNPSGALTASGAWTQTGALTIDALVQFNSSLAVDGTLTLNANAAVLGNLTGSGAISFSGSQQLDLSADWTGTATLSAGTGTVRYQKAGAQSVRTGVAYYSLTIAGSGTKTLGAGTAVVDGVLATFASLDVGAQTLTLSSTAGVLGLGGTVSVGSGGTLNCAVSGGLAPLAPLSFDAGSTVNFNRAGDQPIYNTSYGTIRISGSGIKTLSDPMSVATAVLVDGGTFRLLSTVTMSAGSTFTVDAGATFASPGGTLTTPTPGTDRFTALINGGTNITGLTFRSGETNGLDLQNPAGIVKLENVTFTHVKPAAGAVHLTLAGAGYSIDAPGCFFDTLSGGAKNVKATGAGSVVRLESRSDAANGAGRGDANDLDEDTDDNGIADAGGAVALWIQSAGTPMTGSTQLSGAADALTTSLSPAFDLDTGTYYSTYAVTRDASGGSDRVWVLDKSGEFKGYSYDVPAANGDIVGNVYWWKIGGNRVVFFGTSSGYLYQLIDDGSSLADATGWPFKPAAVDEVTSPVTIDDFNIFFGGLQAGTPKLFGYDLSTQAQTFARDTTTVVRATITAEIVDASTTRLFSGTDANAGTARVWRMRYPDNIGEAQNTTNKNNHIRGAANWVLSDRLFVGDYDGKVHKLDPSSGTFDNLWTSTATGSAIYAMVYHEIAGNRVYFGDGSGKLYKLDASDGSEVWSVPLGAAIKCSAITVGGYVWIADTNGKLFKVNPADGAVVKLYDFGAGVALGDLAADNDFGYKYVMVVGSNGKIWYVPQ